MFGRKEKLRDINMITLNSHLLYFALYQNHKGIHYAIITVYFISFFSFFSSQTLQF